MSISYNLFQQTSHNLQLEISITSNPYQFEPSELFEVGARDNPKRSFLFISKLLGKHLEVDPDIPKASGHLLAQTYIENLFDKKIEKEKISKKDLHKKELLISYLKVQKSTKKIKEVLKETKTLTQKTVFIGFAETATGLGHAVSSAFENGYYIHTTREKLIDTDSVFDFQEEHSHATDHRCYLSETSALINAEEIILIDDEMTTGKTSLNLIRSLHHKYKQKRYTILCLLDWRTKEHELEYKRIEEEYGIQIEVLSFLKGTINVKKETTLSYESKKPKIETVSYEQIKMEMSPKQIHVNSCSDIVSYLDDAGRFGMNTKDNLRLEKEAEKIGKFLHTQRKGEKTLVIGTGEFMYIPSRIASYMGKGTIYKSSTRSPIFPYKEFHYPIQNRMEFQDQDDNTNYLYNIGKQYDEIFVMFEKETPSNVLEIMANGFCEKEVKRVVFIQI